MQLKDLIEKMNITTYSFASETGIPYSTLSDIVSGKTDVRNISASVLYKLSKGLGISMEELYMSSEENRVIYIYNNGRTVEIYAGSKRFSYMGPRNLMGFRNVVDNRNNVLYVDTYFEDENNKIYVEEDYIDLNEIFSGYEELLSAPYEIVISRPGLSRARYLIDNSIMISDNMAIMLGDNGTDDIILEITNIKRNKEKMLLRLRDYSVLFSNMSKKMEERALASVRINQTLLEEEVGERRRA